MGERETREIFSPRFTNTRKKENEDFRKPWLLTGNIFLGGNDGYGRKRERGHMMCLIFPPP